ncbi:metal ABC transporter ATP-binding protein [Shouchella shacheensis]|uniref:metal ABC transporter ATP-binding protein n=1 Tax=Shouchella shacheensis TaxID=1649580 RepID=UPI0007402F9E|nr:metal ABC transporter ATP-binding protein [Shouchella shacheensis]
MNAIGVRDLNASYHGVEVLKDITFTVGSGRIVGIIGPNGAGKSSLIKSMLGLLRIDKGSIQYFDKPIQEIRKTIAYVPQRNEIDWDFPITVLDTVLIGTYPKVKLFKRPKKKEKQLAYQCLGKVGMAEFSQRQIGELSGGQQQRVFLARALAQQPEMLFLDEPFIGIDVASEKKIMTLLHEFRKDGKTIVVIHHDLSKAAVYFDDLLLLNKKLIKYGKAHDVLQPVTLREAYYDQFSFLEDIGVTLT